jgi:hypothetical protein
MIHRRDTGIVDSDVDSAMTLPNRIDHALDGFFIGHVYTMVGVVGQFAVDRLAAATLNKGTQAREMLNQMPTDALPTPGNQDDGFVSRHG